MVPGCSAGRCKVPAALGVDAGPHSPVSGRRADATVLWFFACRLPSPLLQLRLPPPDQILPPRLPVLHRLPGTLQPGEESGVAVGGLALLGQATASSTVRRRVSSSWRGMGISGAFVASMLARLGAARGTG